MSSSHVVLLGNLLSFLRHPSLEGEHSLGLLTVFRRIFTLVSWMYVIVFPIAILITLALKFFNYDGVNAVNEFASSGDFWTVLFMGGLLAPVIEEITFRLPLRFRPLYILIATFFAFRVLTVFILRDNFAAAGPLTQWLTPLVLSIAMYLVVRVGSVQQKLSAFYTNHFAKIFYGIAVFFGLLHITNYSNVGNILVIIVLLGLPQVVAGLVLGFVRIHYGFLYAIITHSLYNSLLLIPSALVRKPEQSLSMALAGLFALGVFSLFVYGSITMGSALYHLSRSKNVRA